MKDKINALSPTTKAYLAMHISIVLWGLTGVLGRGISLSEGMLVWYRLIIVSCSLLLHIILAKKNLKVTRIQFLKLFGTGALLMVHWLFFYGAIKYSNVSITLSCFASTTLFTALLDPLIHRQKIKLEELLMSVLVLLGIGMIFRTEQLYFTGIILAVLAAFIGSFFNILNKEIVREMEREIVAFYELSSGLVVLTLLLPLYISFFQVTQLVPTASDWGLLAVLAILCTHVTILLSFAALKHLSPFILNLTINLEPVYGIALAFVFFGESKLLHSGFYIGTAIILGSVLVHAYLTSKKR